MKKTLLEVGDKVCMWSYCIVSGREKLHYHCTYTITEISKDGKIAFSKETTKGKNDGVCFKRSISPYDDGVYATKNPHGSYYGTCQTSELYYGSTKILAKVRKEKRDVRKRVILNDALKAIRKTVKDLSVKQTEDFANKLKTECEKIEKG